MKTLDWSTRLSCALCMMALVAACGTAQAVEYTFNGGFDGTGTELVTADNWDPDGVPDNDNPGTIPAGFAVTYRSSAALDGKILTLNGDASLDDAGAGSTRWTNGTITLNDTSHWQVDEYGIVIGRNAGDGTTSTLNLNDDATVATKILYVGSASTGIVNQTGGFVTSIGKVHVDLGVATGNRYNLSGGTVLAPTFVKGGDADSWFNFATGSTGTMASTNNGADYTTAFQNLIKAGSIRVGDVQQPTGDYSAFRFDYNGSQTTLELASAPPTLTRMTTAGDILTAGNWDAGLPTNDLPGVVQELAATYSSSAAFDAKTIELRSTGTVSGADVLLGNDGRLELRGGAMTVSGNLGIGSSSNGRLELWQGTMSVSGNLAIGGTGDGRLELRQGTMSVTGNLAIGGNGNAQILGGLLSTSGTLNMDAGNLTVSGGTAAANDLQFGASGFLDFGSYLGELSVFNGGADYTSAFLSHLAGGNVRIKNVVTTDGSAFNIVYDGSTQTSITPVMPQTSMTQSGSVVTSGNWDSGVPNNELEGVISAGIEATYVTTNLNNKILTLNGDATLDDANPGATSWTNGTITLNDTSHWQVDGYGIIVGRDAGGTATLNINDDATIFTKNFQVGRVSTGIVNQTGGYVTAETYLWLDHYTAAGIRYNLSGGTIKTEVFKSGNGPDSWFNFTAGSDGELIVLNGGRDYTDAFKGFIDRGWIRIDDSASALGDYSGFVFEYDTEFKQTVLSLTRLLTWDGGAGNWGDAKWSGGELPVANMDVIIDADTGDSNVTVTATDAPLMPPRAVTIGTTYASSVTVQSDATLSITGEITVGNFGTLVVDGILNADNGSVAGTLAGNGTIIADPIEITGTVAPDGAGVGALTVGVGELVINTGATYDADVSLGDGDTVPIEADTIVLTGVASAIHLGGTLAPKGVGRTSSSFFSTSTMLAVVDNSTGEGVVGGAVVGDTGVEFADVDPAPADDVAAHIGQGAFLRDVNYARGGGAITMAVELDVFVALGGDADGDGKVWLSDWAALRANFGNTGTGQTWTDGNFDPWVDDKVWLSDWATLRANFGNASYIPQVAGAAAVPEPGTIAMLLGLLAGLALLGWRRRTA